MSHSEPVFCINCIHHRYNGTSHVCGYYQQEGKVDLVTGVVPFDYPHLCGDARQFPNLCGQEGRFFEPSRIVKNG